MKQNGRKLSHFCWMLFILFLFLIFLYGIKAQQLDCPEFDQSCQWLNLNSASASNNTLIWYRSSAIIPQDQLLMITGTSVPPNGSYAIVSTINIDTVNNSQSANLISALIPCQNNNATLTFNYWTSPFVILNICYKSEGLMLNQTTDCQRGPYSLGPGPANITIPPTKNPFRIFINATNFIYSNGQLTGGLAIIDDLKYSGDFCSNKTVVAPAVNGTTISSNSTSLPSNSTLPPAVSNSTTSSILATNLTNTNGTTMMGTSNSNSTNSTPAGR